ncbi:MAG: GNAT family N-acetyltransferase, partial [Clostridia bacterium]|nr:GNAT family N-acetyltransferase [Clostridia bacterium]
MNIVYRRLDDSCVRHVYDIERNTFFDAYSMNTIADCASSDLYSKSLVAEIDGKTVAYILAATVAGEAEILRIAVAEELRKCGVGNSLLTQFVNECIKNKIGCIHLEVRQ